MSHDLNAKQRGFTLIEILLVIVVLGVLVALAVPAYQGYVARSHASELALKFDAVRTRMQVAAKSGDVQQACSTLADSVQPGNLQSDFARMAVDFVPVSGGFAPVLTLCASNAVHGAQGVEVTRQAHQLLGRNSEISPGAVLGDSAVSFSVKLAGNAALCKTLPAATTVKSPCTSGAPSATQVVSNTTTANSVVPTPVVSTPVVPTPVATASQPVTPSTAQQVAVVTQPVASGAVASGNGLTAQQAPDIAKVCPAAAPRPVNRQVMNFGAAANGYVASTGNLNTNGNLPAFSAEVVVAADHMQASNAPGATLLSYATSVAGNGFSLWNPQSLHITLMGTEFNTGLNVDNGQGHRLTLSWQSSNGALVLYDNGQPVWRKQNVNTQTTLGGNGRLVIGQDQRVRSGGFATFRDGYSGSILGSSFANRAVTAAQAASGPLRNALQGSSNLLTDVTIGPNGKPVDSTGRATYTASGEVSTQSAPVSTAVYVDSNCQ